MPEDAPQICTPSPFDSDPDADIILRSSDRVDFHVHKLILSKASAFFRNMFTLPLTSTSHLRDSESQTDLPVMDVVEPRSTLDPLLRMCYSIVLTTPVNIDNAWVLLEASKKYAMDGVRERVGQILLTQKPLEERPLLVYALACGYGFPEAAQAAARSSLRSPLITGGSYVDELRCMTGGAYHRLVQYHHICAEMAIAIIKPYPDKPRELSWITDWRAIGGDLCSNASCPRRAKISIANETIRFAGPGVIKPDICWIDYLDRAEAALRSTPYGPVVARKSILEPSISSISATGCSHCGPPFVAAVGRVAEKFAEAVEERISKITLHFEQ